MRRLNPTDQRNARALHLGSLALLLLLAPVSASAWIDSSISPSVAGLFIGDAKVVEGAVTSADRDSNVVRLHLGKAPQEVIVSLVIGLLNNFPPSPETYYAGKTVRVAGTLQSFRGVPEIVLHDAGDIQVVGSNAPQAVPPAASGPALGAAVAAPPVAVPPPRLPVSAPAASATHQPPEMVTIDERIDALGERMRQLEERVRQLESSPSSQ